MNRKWRWYGTWFHIKCPQIVTERHSHIFVLTKGSLLTQTIYISSKTSQYLFNFYQQRFYQKKFLVFQGTEYQQSITSL